MTPLTASEWLKKNYPNETVLRSRREFMQKYAEYYANEIVKHHLTESELCRCITETLVISNKQSVHLAAKKILKLLPQTN